MLSETFAGTEENKQRLKVAEQELAQVNNQLYLAFKCLPIIFINTVKSSHLFWMIICLILMTILISETEICR